MTDSRELLSSIDERVRSQGFRVARGVELPGGPVADLAASKTHFSWKGFVVLSEHIVVRCAESASQADVEALFEAGFRYAKKVNRVPLFRGMQFGYMIIPCLVVNGADEALVRFVENLPPKRWSLFQLPVVVDLSARAVHYCRSTGVWGAFYFSDMRALVERSIAL